MNEQELRLEARKRSYLNWLEQRKGEVPEGAYTKPVTSAEESARIKKTGDILCTAWVHLDVICDELSEEGRRKHSFLMATCLNAAFELGATCFVSDAGTRFVKKTMASKGGRGGRALWHAQAERHIREILKGGANRRGLAKAVDKRWVENAESPRPDFKTLSNFVSAFSKSGEV